MKKKLRRIISRWDKIASRSLKMGMVTQATILVDYTNELRRVCRIKPKQMTDFPEY